MSRRTQIGAQRTRRIGRVRSAVRASGRLRLTVFRSSKHISAQIIDDERGVTLAAASTTQSDVRSGLKSTGNKEAAAKVGKVLAERAKSAGIELVCFDRGFYKYHGRVAALADAAREGGLKF